MPDNRGIPPRRVALRGNTLAAMSALASLGGPTAREILGDEAPVPFPFMPLARPPRDMDKRTVRRRLNRATTWRLVLALERGAESGGMREFRRRRNAAQRRAKLSRRRNRP